MEKKFLMHALALACAIGFTACAAGGEQNNAESALFRLSFDPAISQKAVVDLINDARKTIDVSLYGFENEEVAKALVEAHLRRGIKIRMSTEYDSEPLAGYQKVILAGIPVKLGNDGGIQHNKYFIVDKKYVVTGSTNLTGTPPPSSVSGMWAHYNNMVVLKSEGLAAEFQKDFNIQFEGGKYSSAKDAEYTARYGAGFWPETQYDAGSLKINAYFTPYQNTFSSYSANIMADPVCKDTITNPTGPWASCIDATDPPGVTTSTASLDASCINVQASTIPPSCTDTVCYDAINKRPIYHYYNHDKNQYECKGASADYDDYKSALNIVISLLRGAKKSVTCLFFAFTDRVIMNELKNAKARGLDVKVYMDYNQYRSQYRNSGKSFIDLRNNVGHVKLVRRANGGLNHHKVFYVDGETIVLGSMNYSAAAVTSNDENFLLIRNAKSITDDFHRELARVDEQSFLLPPTEDDGSYIPNTDNAD